MLKSAWGRTWEEPAREQSTTPSRGSSSSGGIASSQSLGDSEQKVLRQGSTVWWRDSRLPDTLIERQHEPLPPLSRAHAARCTLQPAAWMSPNTRSLRVRKQGGWEGARARSAHSRSRGTHQGAAERQSGSSCDLRAQGGTMRGALRRLRPKESIDQ